MVFPVGESSMSFIVIASCLHGFHTVVMLKSTTTTTPFQLSLHVYPWICVVFSHVRTYAALVPFPTFTVMLCLTAFILFFF